MTPEPPLEAGSSAEENGVSTPAAASVTYKLPSWFFAGNVKTLAQLKSFEPKLLFFEPKKKAQVKIGTKDDAETTQGQNEVTHNGQDAKQNSKESDESDETVKANGHTPPEEDGSKKKHRKKAFCVRQETFTSVRDTLASALVRDGHGHLPTHNLGAILCCKKDESAEIFEQYVGALAKVFGVTLLTLTLHDFQALAASYEDQAPAGCLSDSDKDDNAFKSRGWECKENLHPAHKLLLRYFGCRSSKNATDKAKEVSKRAFATIFAAHKQCIRDATVTEPSEDEKKSTETPPADQTLMIHIAEAHLLLKKDQFSRILARLRDFSVIEKKQGRPVILVVSYNSKSEYLDLSGCNGLDHRSGISSSASFTLNFARVPAVLKKRPDSDDKVSAAFVNDLKYLLRSEVRQHFDSETLLPGTKWDLKLGDKVEQFKDHGEELLETIAAQIVGRALHQPMLGLPDIAQVLLQVSMGTKLESEAKSEADDEENDSDSSSDVGPSQRRLNQHEDSLLPSLVKLDELQATKYEDVILNDDIKDTMKQLVLLSRIKVDAKSTFLLSSLQIKGALLYGVPGTGKTHLSRAIASSLGGNMLAVDSAALQSMWVGETEKYIRAAFSLARKYSPCILFFDEVDALFYRRSSDDRSWQRSALTQFLKEMDGLQTGTSDAPFVLVATNRPMDLDSAFLRRLPQKVYCELPDTSARAEILRVLLSDKDLAADVNIERLAATTRGYTGSDLKNLCAEAALLWVIELSQKEAAQKDEASESTNKGDATAGDNAAKSSEGVRAEVPKGAHTVESSDAEHASNGTDCHENVAPQVDNGGGANGGRDAETSEEEDAKAKAKEKTPKKKKNKKDKKQAQSLDMDNLVKMCLTEAQFLKALQKMQPTTSPEALREIDKFARLFNKKGSR